MHYSARIFEAFPDGSVEGLPAVMNELSSVASRQIADRDRLNHRLYSFLLPAERAFPLGLPVWVEHGGSVFVAYPVLQKGKNMRMYRRDGEFFPGVVLERVGAFERTGRLWVVAGDRWYIAKDGPNVYVSEDFETFEDVIDMRGQFMDPPAVCFQGKRLFVAGADEFFYTDDGRTWETRAVSGIAEIAAIAWDGVVLWLAGEGGAYTYDLAADPPAPVEVDASPNHGLSYAFQNFSLYRAERSGLGYDVYDRVGNFFRHVSEAVPLVGWAHNWVVHDGWHYVTSATGEVVRFDASMLNVLGLVGVPAVGQGPATFLLRDTVFSVSGSKLAMVQGTAVYPVYDFGLPVLAYPGLNGFTIVREDGLVYRVRRVSVGAN